MLLNLRINSFLGGPMKLRLILTLLIPFLTLYISAQDSDTEEVEEVVVVGSQIKGATITDALPVTVISTEEIEGFGVDSGDDLISNLAEMGTNQFNQGDFNGGYNANRGDVGSFNLRNVGTGNTLTLLNGRRIVPAAGYHTETIGGSLVPVQSVNSNVLPVYGLERIEILRDGASAVYGSDAVAGVINTVLKKDFDGFSMRIRGIAYDHFAAEDAKVSIQWGRNFDDGSNLSIYLDTYDRGHIDGIEDPKWMMGDARNLYAEQLGAFADTSWRNLSAQSKYAQFYVGNGSNVFSLYRPDDPYCQSGSATNLFTSPLQDNVCLYDASSIRTENRANYPMEGMMRRGDLERHNMLAYYNTTLDNGVEASTEIGWYQSSGFRQHYPGAFLNPGSANRRGQGTQSIRIPSTNYYFNQWVRADGTKFVDAEDDFLWIRFLRFTQPRYYNHERETWRFTQAFAGSTGNWDWDTGIVFSEATSLMANGNRVGLLELEAALAKDDPSAYNPFCAGVNCNEEQILKTIYRENTSSMSLIDFKMSNAEFFEMPQLSGGTAPAGALFGIEVRTEEMTDKRDPNIDGTIDWTNNLGASWPYVSNISNSSPSPNTSGERTVTSYFGELQVPLDDRLVVQAALRGDQFTDVGNSLVGKFAMGWDISDAVKLRGSVSTAFAAPNLIFINEGLVARSNTRTDAVYEYFANASGNPIADPEYQLQRVAQGNPDLKPEESENLSWGFVLEPVDDLLLTVDRWRITKENTLGLFGENNHMLLDLLIRLEGGPSECVGNPLVVRTQFVADEYTAGWPTNLCPAGQVQRIDDIYVNLDTRVIEGTDTTLQYRFDTDVGRFNFKLVNVHYNKYEQQAGGDIDRLIEAGRPGGLLDGVSVPDGFANLIERNGNFSDKWTMNASWRLNDWEVLLSGNKVSGFYETGNTDPDGNFWYLPSMTRLNFTLGYKFDFEGYDARVRFGVLNVEDERAPLADEFWFFSWNDVHNDYGRNYYLEFRLQGN
jgi:outer membrane receptor protein involved in Fe transport|tara:strand:+ start:113 stop:3109 length:2997 start_codon:yes stop_codon:yes gene_type:complete